MRNRLSRMWARMSIMLFAAGVVCLLTGYFVEGWLPTILGVALVVVGMVVRPWKCPVCGKRVNPAPQWSQQGKYHCPYCKSRLAYDDEESDA